MRRFDHSVFLFSALLAATALPLAAQRPLELDLFDVRIQDPSGAVQRPPPPRADYRLRGRLTAPAPGGPEQIARNFLSARGAPPGLPGPGAIELPLAARFETAASGVTHLIFEPRFAGIPFFDASITVHVDTSGRVLRIDERPLPPPVGAVAASRTAEEALTAALDTLSGGGAPAFSVVSAGSSPEAVTVFRSGSFSDNARVNRVWFPLGGGSVSAWRLYVAPRSGQPREIVLDDASGRLLLSLTLTRDNLPQGLVFRAGGHAHPDAGPQSTEDLTGWPAANGGCPSDIYPSPYQSGGEQENRCWVSGAETIGNNADTCLDADGDNACDFRAYDAESHFEFVFTNSYDLDNDPVPDREAAITNAFYWTNVLHDWLYRLGFDEPSGNFQADNFSRGGSSGDAVRVDVQDGNTSNNANFSTPPDGFAPRMQLGLFTGLRRDSAFDGDVIVHEYVHGLTNRLIGGPSVTNGLYIWQSGAMGEGWSDAYAASITNNAVIGEYVTKNPTTGIRSVAYDNSPHTYGDFGLLRATSVSGVGTIRLPQVHRDGEIWATALWDLRTALGASAYDQTLTAALKLTPTRPSMLDARDAILQATETLGVGGADQCIAWSVFAARGFGASAMLNPIEGGLPNDTALSVFEAFDLPEICGGAAPVTGSPLFEDTAEDTAAGWTASGQWHRTTRRAAGGGYSWWFGQEATGNYDTGARVSGTLTSPPIDLTGVSGAIIEWRQYLEGEGFGNQINLGSGIWGPYLNADSGRLRVSNDGGSIWRDVTHLAHNSPADTFVSHRVNLSHYAGDVIQIQFHFDTFDDVDNAHEGWFLDNIRLSALDQDPPRLAVSPTELDFAAEEGGPAPAGQFVSITNGGGGTLSWTATVTSGDAWLSISPESGEGSGSLTVSVSPAGLPAGVYQGTIEISAVGAHDSPAQVTVTLDVSEPSGPLASWPFDETTSGGGVTIADATGNGHDGTTEGTGSIAVTGVVSNARLFDGKSDSAEVPYSAALTPPELSFRAWVNVQRYPGSFGIVFSAFGGSNTSGWYVAIHSSGKVVLMGAEPPDSAPWLTTTTELPLKTWRMITVTLNRATGEAVIYIDGVRDAAATFPGVEADTTQPLRFGRASWYDGAYLNAAIDEAILLPRILSDSEALDDFQSFPAPPPPASANLVAEWKLEETATASGTSLADETSNGHEAVTQGGSSRALSGVDGNGRLLPGYPAYAQVEASGALDGPDFTFSAWVRLDILPSRWGVIYANYVGGEYRGWYVGVYNDGRVILCVAGQPDSSPWVLSKSSLQLGTWHWLTVTFDASAREGVIYIDGVADRSAVFPASTAPSGVNPTFGRASWTNSYYLTAALDEVRLYDAPLSASEVSDALAAYPDPPPPPPGEPVAVWPFDEAASAAGTVFADATGNGHDATAQGTGGAAQAGVVEGARQFGGKPDYATIVSHEHFESEGFTFSTWVKLDAYPSGWGVLFSNYGGNFRGWYVGVYKDGRIIVAVAGEPSSNPWVLSNSTLELGRWRRLTVTFNGASRIARIYIDGALDQAATYPVYTPADGVTPMFARASWTDSYYLGFTADEARYWMRELSSTEVEQEFAAFPAPPANEEAAATAQWDFEETATEDGTVLADSTGNGHDATVEGSGTEPVTGAEGNARRFPGYPNAAAVPARAEYGANDFSFSVWLRPNQYPGSFGVIFSNYAGGFEGWYLALSSEGRVILCVTGEPSHAPWVLSGAALPLGEWTHVAVTFDGDALKGSIYINGALDTEAAYPAYSPQSSVGPAFARATWTNGYYLNADLDRARYFTKELTSAEVQAETAAGP